MRLLEQAVGTAFTEAGLGVGFGHAQDEMEARFAVRGDLRDEQRGPALPRSWPEPWPVSNSIS
jgi:hypothetical protein